MAYALFKVGPGYTGVNVRKTPGGDIVGTLRPNIVFRLTGKKVKHSIEWWEGSYFAGDKIIKGWISSTWLVLHETAPMLDPVPSPGTEPGPVYVPPKVEIPARYDNKLFRNWQEAFWQLIIWVLLGLVVLVSFAFSYDILPFSF